MGSDRARLRELGTVHYRTYGVLKDYNEALLRSLIGQLIEEGYLYQTEERYSVLRMGNIAPLRDENTRVIMRVYEEKEPERKKASRRRSTDSLTAAGYDLFEELRRLRLEIAREEALPPYIIFNDKTLIDMCVKLPKTEDDFLGVSGVGGNKLAKYGAKFLAAIASFVESRPNAVISMQGTADEADTGIQGTAGGAGSEMQGTADGTGSGMQGAADGAGSGMQRAREGVVSAGTDAEKPAKSSASRKNKKPAFCLSEKDSDQFVYRDMCYISEIKDELNRICTVEGVRKATIGAIWEYLVSRELAYEDNTNGVFTKKPTLKGTVYGIMLEDKVSKSGAPYQLMKYPPGVQKMIVDYFVRLRRAEGERDFEKELR